MCLNWVLNVILSMFLFVSVVIILLGILLIVKFLYLIG